MEPLTWDHHLFLWINGFSNSPLDYIFGWTTFLGASQYLLPLVIIFMILWDSTTKLRKRCFWFLGTVIAAGCINGLLKHLFDRDRPYVFFYDRIDQGEVEVNFLFAMNTAHSFPSGHTLTVFATATILNEIYGYRKLWWLFPIALWIGITRVYTGVHFPSDVFAGMLLGLLIAWLSGTIRRSRFS